MGQDLDRIGDNFQRVRETMAAACARARRDAREVALLAVTKSAELDAIQRLVELGQTDLAESRVQQLTKRVAELQAWLADRPDLAERTVHWHMVGHLQRNKVKPCLEAADFLHSLDSLRLAEELSARAVRDGKVLSCLMEVNCSFEAQKEGVAIGAALHLGEQVTTLPGLRLVGLMTMAPLGEPDRARATFVRLRELFEEMRHDKIGGRDFRHLSMGMSDDYAIAIEEGATIVRVGRALFE